MHRPATRGSIDLRLPGTNLRFRGDTYVPLKGKAQHALMFLLDHNGSCLHSPNEILPPAEPGQRAMALCDFRIQRDPRDEEVAYMEQLVASSLHSYMHAMYVCNAHICNMHAM